MVFINKCGLAKIRAKNDNMNFFRDSDLELTKEYFISKKPKIQNYSVWIITGILILFVLYCCFAQFEEVVKTEGLIRPKDNISTVSNTITGKILEIKYW